MIETRMYFEVPVAPLVWPVARLAENMQSPLVLVVEDHPSIRNMLSCVLNLQGFHAVCMTNGLEALQWLQSAHDTGEYPAVILLDLVMPVMDGEVFLESLRSCWMAPVPIPPIMLFTVDQSDHANLACTELLSKPFHIKDLLEKLNRIIQNRQSTTLD